MNSLYTILVNSTDSFEDCWQPFFTLLDKFWPGDKPAIVLNTETKEFRYNGLGIVCSKVGENSPSDRLAWGECLLRCLDKIDTDAILYLQEDYFIEAPVQVERIESLVGLMLAEGYSHILLVADANGGTSRPTKHAPLWEVDQKAPYRISLQAGLWQKERLRYYLRRHETPWQFEVWGSKRAHRVKDSFLCVGRDVFDGPIIPYRPTGIVKGKWEREIVYKLFLENGIDVDFSKRGFYDPHEAITVKRPFLNRAVARLRSVF